MLKYTIHTWQEASFTAKSSLLNVDLDSVTSSPVASEVVLIVKPAVFL